jgi:O-antigen/teichoic acid export membrane protein
MTLARSAVAARRGTVGHDLLWTSMVSVASGVALVLVTRLLANGLGPDDFGAYAVAKRVLGILGPIATLAMGIALARHVAIADPSDTEIYLLAGMIVVVPIVVVLGIALLIGQQAASNVVGGRAYPGIAVASVALLAGQTCYTVLYAYYRGARRMARANVWQLGVGTLAPIVITATLARPGRVALVLVASASVYLLALVPLAIHVKRALARPIRARVMPRIKELVGYGLPRVPGAIALTAIFAAGPILAAQVGTLRDSGHLVIGQSVFVVAEMLVAGVGIVLLPHAARLVHTGQGAFLRDRIGDIFALTMYLGAFLSLHLLVWADEIVDVWLGAEYAGLAPVFRILVLGLIPYAWYSVLRSIVDAIDVRAVNARNVLAASCLTVLGSAAAVAAGLGVIGLAAATTVGVTLLGVLTVTSLVRRQWFSTGAVGWRRWALLNGLAAGMALALKLSPSGPPPFVSLLAGAGIFVGYCLILRSSRVPCVTRLEALVASRAS